MTYDELKQAQASDEYAPLRAAFVAGARIQAWHLPIATRDPNQGQWDTIPGEPSWQCLPHLYRVHPDDLHKVELGAENVIAHDRAALKLIGMGYAYNGTEWAHPLLPFDSDLVRDKARLDWLVSTGSRIDTHSGLGVRNDQFRVRGDSRPCKWHDTARQAIDAAIHAQAGGSES